MTEAEQQPVLVAVAPNELIAHMLQHVLETEGVESFVFGGNAKSVLFIAAATQVRLEVRQIDYEKARQLLEAFQERLDASLPEQNTRGHCPVCGQDRAELAPDDHCPECGAQASVWKINEGKFEIACPPDEQSTAAASFFGYAVFVVLAVFLAIGAANLMGLI